MRILALGILNTTKGLILNGCFPLVGTCLEFVCVVENLEHACVNSVSSKRLRGYCMVKYLFLSAFCL
jgi:hypothetical protein